MRIEGIRRSIRPRGLLPGGRQGFDSKAMREGGGRYHKQSFKASWLNLPREERTLSKIDATMAGIKRVLYPVHMLTKQSKDDDGIQATLRVHMGQPATEPSIVTALKRDFTVSYMCAINT